MNTELDDIRILFDAGDAAAATHRFIRAAEAYRSRTMDDPDAWLGFVERCDDIISSLRADPITGRAASRPRGYPGDAVLLDLIYEEPAADLRCGRQSADLGATVNSIITAADAPVAARWRRDHIAAVIDHAAASRPDLSVLSVACGHCRELERSLAAAAGRLGRFVALDQDPLSLDVARRDNGPLVEPRQQRISEVIGGGLRGEQFDLIYSLGLYDYLPDDAGTALTHHLMTLLNPEGELIIANYAPGHLGRGYMESAMDWWLIHRNETDVFGLVGELPSGYAARTYRDPAGTLVFLSIRRN